MLGACERPAVVVFLRKPSRVGDLGRRRFDPSPECTTEAEETVNAARIAGEGQWESFSRSRSRWTLIDCVCGLSGECLLESVQSGVSDGLSLNYVVFGV